MGNYAVKPHPINSKRNSLASPSNKQDRSNKNSNNNKPSKFKQFFSRKKRTSIKKTVKPILEPKPFQGRVNPQNAENFVDKNFDYNDFSQKNIPVMKILVPSFKYREYKVLKLKKYLDYKVIYTVVDSHNMKKLLYQYKFYDIKEINSKCKTISSISKLDLKNFPHYEDFFIEIEEFGKQSFFYLNVICHYKKNINLVEIIKNLHRKPTNKIEEADVWCLFQTILTSIHFAYHNKILLENFDLSKMFYNLPNKKFNEEKSEGMTTKLLKILGKGLKKNFEIIFFNRKSPYKNKKPKIYKISYLKRLISSKPVSFDFVCFREISSYSSQIKALEYEANLFKEIYRFFMMILSNLSKISLDDLLSCGLQYIDETIGKLEYSFNLKMLFVKACIYNYNLPRSLNHIYDLLQQYHENFKNMPAIEKSLSKQDKNNEFSLKNLQILDHFLYYFVKDCLILAKLKPKSMKTPNLAYINFKSIKPKEVLNNFLKGVAWDQKNSFYLIFNISKKKGESDKVYKFEIDVLDIQSKIEENPCSYFEDFRNNKLFLIEEFVTLKYNFSPFEVNIENPSFLKISGFDSLKNKIQFYTINLKNKDFYLVKETTFASPNIQIIDFWNYNEEIWFWKKISKRNFTKDILEIHNIEKNQVSTLEIDENTYQKILLNEKTVMLSSLEFYCRPVIFKDLKKILIFLRVKNKIVMLYSNFIDGLKNSVLIDFDENLKGLLNFNSLNNFLTLNEREIYVISNQEDELYLDFYEFDEQLITIYNENTHKIWSFKLDDSNEINNFMGDFTFNQYKVTKCNHLAESYEIMDETRGKYINIFKRKIPLDQDNFHDYSLILIFHDTKFFFDMIYNEDMQKLIYVPESFYFSSNYKEHNMELWLFYEKKSKSLYEYLNDFKDNRSYDAIGVFYSIFKKYLKLKKMNLYDEFLESFTLENIIMIYNYKKNRFEFKFDVLTQNEKDRISYYFIYFQIDSFKFVEKKNIASDFLKEILNDDLKKMILILFFIYFPNFLQKSEINLFQIERFLSRIKLNIRFYSKEVIELIEKVLFSENRGAMNLESLFSITKTLISHKKSDFIDNVLKNKNIFSIQNDSISQKEIYFVKCNYPLFIKYNIFSKQINKFIVFYSKNQRYDMSNVLTHCVDYKNNILFCFGSSLFDNNIIFFSIDTKTDKDECIMNILPYNDLNVYESRKDFQPTTIVYFNNFIYQIGGELKFFQNYKGCKDCFAYNIQLKKWFTIAKLHLARKNPGVVASNQYIFVFGGALESESCNTENGKKNKICVEKYHPTVNKWEKIYIRNLDNEYFDFFYSNMKFITCLDSEKTFIILNLQMNKCFILLIENEGEIYETTIAEPFNMMEILEKNKIFSVVDSWCNDKMILMNKIAEINFIENGRIFNFQVKEIENEFRIIWDPEVLIWNLI